MLSFCDTISLMDQAAKRGLPGLPSSQRQLALFKAALLEAMTASPQPAISVLICFNGR